MIISNKPSLILVLKDQIKLVNSFDIDSRMPWREKVEFFGLKAYTIEEISLMEEEDEEEEDEEEEDEEEEDEEEEDINGYYDAENKCIVLDNLEDEHLHTVISHELSHHIQNLTCDFIYDTVGECMAYEQQAESISKFLLMPKLFPSENVTYNPYFTLEDADWLAEYFGDEIQDDRKELRFSFKRKFY